MKELGQRSVASLLVHASASSGKRGGQLSLTEFLDKRSAAAPAITRKQVCLREDKDEEPQLDCSLSTSSDLVRDSLTSHRLSKKRHRSNFEDQGNRGVKTEEQQQRRQRQGNGYGGARLLVISDAPMGHSRVHKSRLYQKPNYNHYADGCGWWGEGMVGMEEGSTAWEWEGVASMSLGTSATAP
ncbi:hypothetical protein L7F22_037923 [Adiantum nelumboides]|nr:hypothetical protein [Adiantum nelumboides]